MALRTTPQTITSPVYKIRGQKSRWRYPDERMSPESTRDLENVNLSEFGTCDTRYGYIKYSQTQLSGTEPVVGLREQLFKSGNTRRVVITPTKVYNDDGTTRTDLTGSALTGASTNRARFAFISDTLLFTNGVDQVQTWDGDTGNNCADLTGMPWTACQDIIEHKGIMLAFNTTEGGVKYPTRIRWSDVDKRTFVADINTWPETNRYDLYEDGSPIVGAVDNFGSALVFKGDGLYPGAIEYDAGFIEFRPGAPIRGFSPVAKNSLIARPEFVFGVAKEGAFIIRPDFSFQIVTLDIQNEWRGLNSDRLDEAVAYIREDEHQVRVLMAGTGVATGFDRELVFDWETGDTWFDYPTHTMNYATSIRISGVEYDWKGSTTGYLYQGNNSAYEDDDGTGYEWRVRMQPNDLGRPGVVKKITYFKTLTRQRSGSTSMTLTLYRNQGALPTRTRQISLSGAVWTTDNSWNLSDNWNSGGIQEDEYFVNRRAENITPQWTGSAPATLVGYQVSYVIEEG